MTNEATAVLDEDTADEDDEDEDEVHDDDNEAEGADDESASDDGDPSDSNGDGGSGDTEGDESLEGHVASAPTGKALLDLLASDNEAQQLMAYTLQNMMQENAHSAAQQAEAQEFNDLVEKGDYNEIGRRLVDRATTAKARESIADEVLQEQFRPVYADLFAQPELQSLSAEEKEALSPQRFSSDAVYVRAVSEFIATKRFSATVEAEVEKRIKARDEAAGNREAAGKAKSKSMAASPGGTEGSGVARGSRDLIGLGLRQAFFGGEAGDGDDD